MDQIGDRTFIDIPGSRDVVFELPPIMFPSVIRLDGDTIEIAEKIVESDLLPDFLADDLKFENSKMDLACQMAEKYTDFCFEWHVGDSIIDWISQCEFEFKTTLQLSNILRPDLWPHAGQSSFVRLLEDKNIIKKHCLKKSVGLRLQFRHCPPIESVSDHFLFYLSPKIAETSYLGWENLMPRPTADFPPERFHFSILEV